MVTAVHQQSGNFMEDERERAHDHCGYSIELSYRQRIDAVSLFYSTRSMRIDTVSFIVLDL